MENVLISSQESALASTDVLLVPTGTSIISPQVEKYIQQYRGFARQTAMAIIGLANTLVEAESNLTVDEFKEFCAEVGLERGGSIFKKMKVIGKEAGRFQSVMDRLPNTWTTIYQLAKIDTQDFTKVARSNALSPFMTAQELATAIGKEKQVVASTASPEAIIVPDFQIYTTNLRHDAKKEVYAKLQELSKSYGFKMDVRSSFSDGLVVAECKLAA